jgi:hypothetical protein
MARVKPPVTGEQSIGMVKGVSADKKVRQNMLAKPEVPSTVCAQHRLFCAT